MSVISRGGDSNFVGRFLTSEFPATGLPKDTRWGMLHPVLRQHLMLHNSTLHRSLNLHFPSHSIPPYAYGISCPTHAAARRLAKLSWTAGVALCLGAARALRRRQHQVFARQRRKHKHPLYRLAGHPSDPDCRKDLIEGLPWLAACAAAAASSWARLACICA